MEKFSKSPLISIIVPVFNREDVLLNTLQSIVEQTYRPLELILVDNNSEDSSMALCHQFQANNNNEFFRTEVYQEMNKGANAARNRGLSLASGDYLMFFDSDDLMYPDCIARIVTQLTLNNYPKAIAFPYTVVFPNGNRGRRPHYYSANPADQLFDILICTHNVCLKRTLPEKTGTWVEDLQRWQDLEFGFRVLLLTNDLAWITGKPLYEVNFHKNSISGSSYTDDHEKLYTSLMKIRATIEKQPDSLDKFRLQRALCYKIGTIASLLRREKNKALGRKYLEKALLQMPKRFNKRGKLLLRFQFFYEGLGGRGLWRLARVLM
ncbi:MAG TPA: glycosyltransferase family A protein [Bacteroidales bacterium]|nr:glycosyltransferase family A protein [Bacteroidales bacterium]